MTGPVNCCARRTRSRHASRLAGQGVRQVGRERPLKKVEGLGIKLRPPAARRFDGVGDAAAVFGAHAVRVGVGPVDVERGHGLRQRSAEGAAAEIALAQREQPPGQRLQLGVQLPGHHFKLGLAHDVRRGGRPAR